MTATRPSGGPYGPEGAGNESEAGPDGDGPPQGRTALRERLGGALAPHWPVHMSRNVEHHRKQILSAADAVLPVVEAETVAKDAEIRRLGEAVDADGGRIHRLRAELAEQRQRAEQAERERDFVLDAMPGLDTHMVLFDPDTDPCVDWCPKCLHERALKAERERDEAHAALQRLCDDLPTLERAIRGIAATDSHAAIDGLFACLRAALDRPKETPDV